MRLIKPSEISARILTLLDESDERIILVSPYIKISKWYKFTNTLNRLNSRGIPIEIYVRDDPDNISTYKDLDKLALPYEKIPHLHSKLYLNEKSGIATSMNLLLSSEFKSLELGYETENREEFNDLLGYFLKYIQKRHSDSISAQPAGSLDMLTNSIREELENAKMNSWFWIEKDKLHISTGNSHYCISINEGTLQISFSLNAALRQNKNNALYPSLISKKIEDLTAMKIEINPGLIPDIMLVSGEARQMLKSISVKALREPDIAFIIESVCRFIKATDNPFIMEVTDSSGP